MGWSGECRNGFWYVYENMTLTKRFIEGALVFGISLLLTRIRATDTWMTWTFTNKLNCFWKIVLFSFLFSSIYDFEDSSSRFVVVWIDCICIYLYIRIVVYFSHWTAVVLVDIHWINGKSYNDESIIWLTIFYYFLLLLVFKVKVHRKLSYFCERFIFYKMKNIACYMYVYIYRSNFLIYWN